MRWIPGTSKVILKIIIYTYNFIYLCPFTLLDKTYKISSTDDCVNKYHSPANTNSPCCSEFVLFCKSQNNVRKTVLYDMKFGTRGKVRMTGYDLPSPYRQTWRRVNLCTLS